jgi:hypothetical protein
MDEFEPKDPWHYPRPKLAEKYLKVFDIGLIAAQGIFAKRRMGKSEFLEKDLLPAARGHQYLTAYVNLWDARKHPASSLIAALTLSFEPRGMAKRDRHGTAYYQGHLVGCIEAPARGRAYLEVRAWPVPDPGRCIGGLAAKPGA